MRRALAYISSSGDDDEIKRRDGGAVVCEIYSMHVLSYIAYSSGLSERTTYGGTPLRLLLKEVIESATFQVAV